MSPLQRKYYKDILEKNFNELNKSKSNCESSSVAGGTSASSSDSGAGQRRREVVDLSARANPVVPPLPTNSQQALPQSPDPEQSVSKIKSVPPKCKTCLEPFRGTKYGHAAKSCPLLAYQGFEPLP